MKRACILAFMLVFSLGFGGCAATIAKLDGTTEAELAEFLKSEEQIEIERLEKENQTLQTRLNTYQEDRKKRLFLEKQVGALAEQVKGGQAEKSEYVEKMSKLEMDKNSFEKQIAGLDQEKRALKNRLSYLERKIEIKNLAVKVLSGDGDIQSARKMADRLKTMGYRVIWVDLAPRKTFKRHTVFFAPTFEQPADVLVDDLGNGAVSKPLSWGSIFNIIVVTGKRPQ